MTGALTTRTSLEQSLEPRELDQSALTLSGLILSWNLRTILPAQYTLAGNYQLATPNNMVSGMEYTLALVQDSTGYRKVTWGTAFLWHMDEEPELSTYAGNLDVLKFYCDGTYMYGRHVFKQVP